MRMEEHNDSVTIGEWYDDRSELLLGQQYYERKDDTIPSVEKNYLNADNGPRTSQNMKGA